MIGRTVRVVVDRPLGSRHPEYDELVYPINYGYVPGVMATDGEEQDVYILGVDRPVDEFCGTVIAVIKRLDDIEDKWVAAPEGMKFSREKILQQVEFQEKYFDSLLITEPK